MIFDPSPGTQVAGLFFAVNRLLHVSISKLKSYVVCACCYIQWGALGSGLKLLAFGLK